MMMPIDDCHPAKCNFNAYTQTLLTKWAAADFFVSFKHPSLPFSARIIFLMLVDKFFMADDFDPN